MFQLVIKIKNPAYIDESISANIYLFKANIEAPEKS